MKSRVPKNKWREHFNDFLTTRDKGDASVYTVMVMRAGEYNFWKKVEEEN